MEIKASETVKIQQQENICTLSIKETKAKNAGKYSCHLKNSLGEAVCSAGLTLLDKAIKGVPMLPKFLKRIGEAPCYYWVEAENHPIRLMVLILMRIYNGCGFCKFREK